VLVISPLKRARACTASVVRRLGPYTAATHEGEVSSQRAGRPRPGSREDFIVDALVHRAADGGTGRRVTGVLVLTVRRSKRSVVPAVGGKH